MMTLDHPIRRHLVLTREQCTSVVKTICALESHWVQRAEGIDFYTLGAASYLDGASDADVYKVRAGRDNALLKASFAELYSNLCLVLTAAYGPVRFHPQLALPGFHIFAPRPGHGLLPGTQAFARAGGSVHVDLQYRLHGSLWQGFERIDWARPLSFTLALALPACGGGLRIWPRTTGVTEAEPAQAEEVFYRQGELVSFTEPLLHQIAPAAALEAGDQRITLQGHGLCCDGTWQLYF